MKTTTEDDLAGLHIELRKIRRRRVREMQAQKKAFSESQNRLNAFDSKYPGVRDAEKAEGGL